MSPTGSWTTCHCLRLRLFVRDVQDPLEISFDLGFYLDELPEQEETPANSFIKPEFEYEAIGVDFIIAFRGTIQPS